MKKKLSILLVCLFLSMGIIGIASANLYDGNPAPIVYYKWMWDGGFPHLVKCVQVLPNMVLSVGTTPLQYWNIGTYDWTKGFCAKCTVPG